MMRKAFTLLFLFFILLSNSFGQFPQGMNYQAVVHDNSGNIIPNHAIGIKFNIRQGSGSGTIVYAETQTPTSDQFGGIALVIGQGTVVSGNFATINWAGGIYFNEVLLDVTGGANYVSMGASQLMSVPYALYANSSGTLSIPYTTDYRIKFNGVDIRDSSLNFVALGNDFYLTKNNYYFETVATNGYSSFYPSNKVSTVGGHSVGTSDTLVQSSIYLIENDTIGTRGKIFQIGAAPVTPPYGCVSNHTGQIYYIPLNAQVITATVFYISFSPPRWVSDTFQIFQAFPNDPVITGYNLPNTFAVKYER